MQVHFSFIVARTHDYRRFQGLQFNLLSLFWPIFLCSILTWFLSDFFSMQPAGSNHFCNGQYDRRHLRQDFLAARLGSSTLFRSCLTITRSSIETLAFKPVSNRNTICICMLFSVRFSSDPQIADLASFLSYTWLNKTPNQFVVEHPFNTLNDLLSPSAEA